MKISDSPSLVKSMFRYLSIFVLLIIFSSNTCAFGAEKSYGSIGASVVPTSAGHLVVLKVLEKSPAAKKGILPGDLIFEVNGFDLTGSDFTQVVTKHLWGVTGTEVSLKILRPGKDGVINLRLRREKTPEKPADLPGVKMILPK
jgi:C-terminal processing protease CtpA/Prc